MPNTVSSLYFVRFSTPDRMHSQVRTWTKNVDIFEKDFVIVPINERYVARPGSEKQNQWSVSFVTI